MNPIKKLLFGEKATESTPAHGEYAGSTQKWLPVQDIRNGVILTRSGRYVKLLEVLPVNFYLKSPIDQQNIIFYFASYLRVAPDNLQIQVLTQKADMEAYQRRMEQCLEAEENPLCRELIQDNIREVSYLAASEAVTRRFFLIFQLEEKMKTRGSGLEAAADRLREEAETARRYLELCGLEAVEVEYPDNYLLELLYAQMNPRVGKLPEGVFDMMTAIHGVYDWGDTENAQEQEKDRQNQG